LYKEMLKRWSIFIRKGFIKYKDRNAAIGKCYHFLPVNVFCS
jgi:hypothetical protein